MHNLDTTCSGAFVIGYDILNNMVANGTSQICKKLGRRAVFACETLYYVLCLILTNITVLQCYCNFKLLRYNALLHQTTLARYHKKHYIH